MVTANSNRKGRHRSRSSRSLAITNSFGSSICETIVAKGPEISWTPPPHHFEFGSSDDEEDNLNKNHFDVKSSGNVRAPSRINSYKSAKSTASNQYPPTREDLEQAALTLMAARQHGLTVSGGPLYEDIFDELASTNQHFDSVHSGDRSNHGSATDSPRKKHCSHVIDSIAEKSHKTEDIHSDECNSDDDDDIATKFRSDESLNSSLIDSVRNGDDEPKQSFSKSHDQYQDFEQNSSIVGSNVSVPKTISVAEEDDEVFSMQSLQNLCNHPKQEILNRGGTFQPRNANCHARPGLGTNILAGSARTMSSMSSIGEEDHLLIKNSLEQKHSQISHRRQNLQRMESFSRYPQGSCRTLGSLSTIEVVTEEDTREKYSIEDMSTGSSSNDRISVSSSTPSVQPGEEIAQEGAHCDERKEPPSYNQDETPLLSLPTRNNGLLNQYDTSPTEQDEEICSNNNVVRNDFVNHDTSAPIEQEDEVNFANDIACSLCKKQLIILREFAESPDQIRKALEKISECETTQDGENEENLSGIETVVTSMQSHAAAYDVQLWGCRAILNISSSSDRVQKAFIQARVPAVVTQAMKRFLERGEDLQEEAITVLSNFAVNRPNIDFLVCKGDDSVDAIISAMGRYPGSARLQTKGCEALAILASHNDSMLRLRIMDKGAGEAILFNAVAMHSEDFIVQKSALTAVRNLSTDCEENQNRLLELGVVDPILSAMKKHRNVAGLQEAGAGAISILAGNNVETKKVIEENGGIYITLRAILDHSNLSTEKECYIRTLLTLSLDSYNGNNSESRTSEENIKAAGAISAIINAINVPQENNNPSKLTVAIDAVVIAMEAHEDVPVVQEVGCAILCGLSYLDDEGIATNSDQTKMDIVDEGALDAINMAMVLHRHEGRVQKRACGLLLGLAIEENYPSIVAAIGIHLLEDTASNFPGVCRDLANRLIKLLNEN